MPALVFGGDSGTAYGGGGGGHYGEVGIETSPNQTALFGRSRVDGIIVPMPDYTRGDITTFEVVIDPHSGIPFADERYNQLRDRMHTANADSLVTDTMFDGTPWYSEHHLDETLLVNVEPGPDATQVRGVWGLIVGGTDSTERAEAHYRLSIDVFVLALLDEYDSRHAVRADFER